MRSKKTDANENKLASEEPITDKDVSRIDALLKRYDEIDLRITEAMKKLSPYEERILYELAGSNLEIMTRSQESTISFLTSLEPKLRKAALWLAHLHWKITDALANQYEQMALSDPSPLVKEEAIAALGTCYALSKNRRIGQLLASIVRKRALLNESV